MVSSGEPLVMPLVQPTTPGEPGEVPHDIPSVTHTLSGGCHGYSDNAALLLVIGYGKMCLHSQNSSVCISDYVANPLIFDLNTKNIWVLRFCTPRYNLKAWTWYFN